MSASITCGSCGASYRWKPELAGKKVKCKCGQPIQIPATAPGGEAASHAPKQPAAASAAPAAQADAGKDDTLDLRNPGGIAAAVVALALVVWVALGWVNVITGKPTPVKSVEEALALSHHDYVELDLPLDLEDAVLYEQNIGKDQFAVIPFAGSNGKLRFCMSDPKSSSVPSPVVGRVVKRSGGKYRVYGSNLDFDLPGGTILITAQGPARPNDWFSIGAVIATIYLLAFVKILLTGPIKLETKEKDEKGQEVKGETA